MELRERVALKEADLAGVVWTDGTSNAAETPIPSRPATPNDSHAGAATENSSAARATSSLAIVDEEHGDDDEECDDIVPDDDDEECGIEGFK